MPASRKSPESKLVQPILVSKVGSHEATIGAAALASYLVSDNEDSNEAAYVEWLSGMFTKSVRRASPGDITKVIRWAEENAVGHRLVQVGDSQALALDPMAYEEYPKIISRCQVAGTDFPKVHHRSPQGSHVRITLLESLTTGKAAAQAAHALWLFTLKHERTGLAEAWEDSGQKVVVAFVSASALTRLASADVARVVDSGLTEIEPQTLTAVAEFIQG